LSAPTKHKFSVPAIAAEPPQRPYSCKLLDDEQRKCSFGSCDKRTVERLHDRRLQTEAKGLDDPVQTGNLGQHTKAALADQSSTDDAPVR
jgi:hypothetical protein